MKQSAVILGALVLALFGFMVFTSDETSGGNAARQSSSSASTNSTSKTSASSALPTNSAPIAKSANCPALPPISDDASFLKARFTSLSAQLKNLQSQHDEFLLDNISIVSRIGLFAGREMRDGYRINFKNPLFVTEQVKQASPDAKTLLRTLLNNNDYKQLAQAVSSGQIPSSESYFGAAFRVFLIERILEAKLENAEQAIEPLLDVGVTVWYGDIIAAIRSDLSDELVKKLFQHSRLNASAVMQKGTLFLSLTNIAIEQQRADLARYFLEMGSPIAPDRFNHNALDLLAKHHDSLSPQQVTTLFNAIYPVSNTYHVSATPERLRNLLSDELKTKPLKAALPPELTTLQSQQLNQSALTLYRVALTGIVAKSTLSQLTDACLAQHGQKVILKVMQADRTRRVEQAEQRKKAVNKTPVTSADTQLNKLQAIQQQFATPKEIEAALAPQQTLEQKRLVQRYRSIEIEKKAKKILQEQAADDLAQSHQQLMQQVYALAQQNRWKEAQQLLSKAEPLEKEAATLLLSVAINTSADKAILLWLLNEGAQILPNAITGIVAIGDIERAELLLKHGLDIHYIDPLNRNALFTAVTVNNIEMLRWLLRKGISLQPEQAGLDVLDHALLSYTQNRTQLAMLSAIIQAGITIETSHQEIVAGMVPNQLNRYTPLINLHPELIMQKALP